MQTKTVDKIDTILYLYYIKTLIIEAGYQIPEGVGGGGGTLIFSSYVGSGPASTLHPKKKSGISSTPKNI